MINESKIRQIQEKIKQAIADIEKEENVKIEFGSIRYSPVHYSTQLTVKSLEKNEMVDKVLLSTCKRLGFTQNIIGMQFHGRNGVYTITEIKVKNFKYPVIAKGPDEKYYKYSVDHIKRLIGGDKIINRNANLDKLLGD